MDRCGWPLVVWVLLAVSPRSALAEPGSFVEEDVTVLQVLAGEGENDQFGWAVSELADINGDDAMEIIVGAPQYNADGAGAGRTYVYSGGDGALLYTFTGAPGDLHGYAMSDAGDVDGDGFHDILAGAPGGGGRVFVYSGASGETIHTLSSEGMLGFFGGSVASAGDVDDDGLADILVGAPIYPSMGDDGGRVYLFSGASGLPIRHWDAEKGGDKFGSAVAYLGDVNDDGVPDSLVGARDAGEGGGGEVYVYSGADGELLAPVIQADDTGVDLAWFFVAGLGDLDGDEIPEIYAGDFANNALGPATGRAYVFSGASREPMFVFTGGGPGEGLGPGRRGGDQNGDGVPDVVACSYSSSIGAPGAGQLSIFSGADGALLRTLTSTSEGESLGFDAVSLGDVNFDGSDDFVVSGASKSIAYVIAGHVADSGETEGSTGETEGETEGESIGSTGTTDASSSETGAETTGTSDTAGSGPSSSGGSPTVTSAGSATSDSGNANDSGEGGCGCQQAEPGDSLPTYLVFGLFFGLLLWPKKERRHSA